VNAPSLSRRLATRIIEGLQGRGRIVVVRGSTPALICSVDDAVAAFVIPIVDRFEREPSSWEEQPRESIALLAATVANTLFSSEHLEDVFADRSVVEREVFDAATVAFIEESEAERARVMRIELDLLGYVAATAGKLAAEEVVIVALERTADSFGVKLSEYDAVSREAIFEPGTRSFPDLRLELEEAVADELCSLVMQGIVKLPVVQRTRPLVHHVGSSRRNRLLPLIECAANRTLRRTGCSAGWELTDDCSVRIAFTPLSERDARDVDAHVSAFAAELDAILANAAAPLGARIVTMKTSQSVGTSRHSGVRRKEPKDVAEPEPDVVSTRVSRVVPRAKKVVPRAVPKRTPATRATKRTEASAAEKTATRKKKDVTVKRGTVATKKTRAAKKSR
jgi:hypothetical protein